MTLPPSVAMAAFDLAAASWYSPGARFCTPGRLRSITNRFIALLHKVGLEEAALSARRRATGSGRNVNLPWHS